jgi:hypothetical protein
MSKDFKVTCGECGQSNLATKDEAIHEGPECCPTQNYTIEGA